MVASVASDAFAWSPGQELTVGQDIEEGLAIALCRAPADSPRAVPIGWDPNEVRAAAAAATPAEKRETATQPRRGKQTKPPGS